jgi:hypothetical protein
MGALVEVVRPLILAAMNSCHTKKLVCELLDRYAKSTDNDIDDMAVNLVRTKLLNNCPE